MSFKTEFQRYKKAVEDDIKELEIVITWLDSIRVQRILNKLKRKRLMILKGILKIIENN